MNISRHRPKWGMLSWVTTNLHAQDNHARDGAYKLLNPTQIANNTSRGITPGLINPDLGESAGRVPLPSKLGGRTRRRRKRASESEPEPIVRKDSSSVGKFISPAREHVGILQSPQPRSTSSISKNHPGRKRVRYNVDEAQTDVTEGDTYLPVATPSNRACPDHIYQDQIRKKPNHAGSMSQGCHSDGLWSHTTDCITIQEASNTPPRPDVSNTYGIADPPMISASESIDPTEQVVHHDPLNDWFGQELIDTSRFADPIDNNGHRLQLQRDLSGSNLSFFGLPKGGTMDDNYHEGSVASASEYIDLEDYIVRLDDFNTSPSPNGLDNPRLADPSRVSESNLIDTPEHASGASSFIDPRTVPEPAQISYIDSTNHSSHRDSFTIPELADPHAVPDSDELLFTNLTNLMSPNNLSNFPDFPNPYTIPPPPDFPPTDPPQYTSHYNHSIPPSAPTSPQPSQPAVAPSRKRRAADALLDTNSESQHQPEQTAQIRAVPEESTRSSRPSSGSNRVIDKYIRMAASQSNLLGRRYEGGATPQYPRSQQPRKPPPPTQPTPADEERPRKRKRQEPTHKETSKRDKAPPLREEASL
ncbi:MAG: hypothetical protein Q9219_002688 [cf. Caloplaca sp. 3 TL-2023]